MWPRVPKASEAVVLRHRGRHACVADDDDNVPCGCLTDSLAAERRGSGENVAVKGQDEEFAVTQLRMSTPQDGKPCGSSRSLVRRIASHLPLKPCVRANVQLGAWRLGEGARELTLADIVWVVDDEGESFTRLRTEVRPEACDHGSLGSQLAAAAMMLMGRGGKESGSAEVRKPRGDGGERGLATLLEAAEPGECDCGVETASSEAALSEAAPDPPVPSDDAMRKISALEEELARLRVQIAMIVAVHEQQASCSTSPDGPAAPPPPPPGPPPPPPPLPPTGADESSRMSTLALIKQRRAEKGGGEGGAEKAATACVPNMMDVLKGIDKVKLRTVDRSPGGTPAKGKQGEVDEDDPVAMIAAALKRKFAHRYNRDASPEKERAAGRSRPLPHTGAEQPKFGQHMLRATGQRKSVENGARQLRH
ncbi:mitochondrial fission regulator 1-like isoform X1 [Lethenteron reissneri]|uniref:mitochondrial fission regulator 1-like isoform X1 n=2 Tax=Lethenteron reissneri TaxID=7753 RepID=UPI002AB73C36|nr:mitochondrial fission regulator 1-like isoform X1 [Lethenteron reissneri]